jgi:dihydroxy-acid dehydratase
MRSDTLKKGISRAPARAMLKGAGYSDADLEKPLVGIANTWSDVTPCNVHLRALAEKVKVGIREAGGTPVEFNTIVVSDGISMGTEGMRASLVSREVIADSIELFTMGHMLDGVVALSGCDKTIPGTVMALARLDVPALMLYGGAIAPGRFEGRDVTIQDVFEAVGAHSAGKMSEKELRVLEDHACPGAGACGGQYTANTMATSMAFLGISPMGANEVPAMDPRKDEVARACGRTVMRLVRDDVRPRSLITRASLENAITVAAATAGSTNAVLHLLAIAYEAGVPLRIDDFDPISARTPVLTDLKPGGRFTAVDMERAGGERLLGARLEELGLLKDTPTCSGRTLFQELADAKETPGQQVVRPATAPFKPRGGFAILRGSLAPEGCVARRTWVRRACSTAKKRRSPPCRRARSSPKMSSSSATRARAAVPGCARCSASRRRSSAAVWATPWPSRPTDASAAPPTA